MMPLTDRDVTLGRETTTQSEDLAGAPDALTEATRSTKPPSRAIGAQGMSRTAPAGARDPREPSHAVELPE
jgi:hypothetical protein